MPDAPAPAPALGPHGRPARHAPADERLLSTVRAFLRRGKRQRAPHDRSGIGVARSSASRSNEETPHR